MCCNRIEKSKLMMSVLCSHTLIFAPECWKCILRCPDFNFFSRNSCSQVTLLPQVFFLLLLLQAYATYLKSYLNLWDMIQILIRIQDQSDHGKSHKLINPFPGWIHQFLWCARIQVISDHWYLSGSSQWNAPQKLIKQDIKIFKLPWHFRLLYARCVGHILCLIHPLIQQQNRPSPGKIQLKF